MKKFIKNKKAELTTQQIVLLIILIVSFAIVLFFLFRLNFGKNNQDQICHNSVLMKGNSALPASSVSLKCQRTYVCLTKDGSCEKMNKPEIKKVKTEDDVYEVLANEMVNCWWMFGEGKINYVGNDAKPNNYCSICFQIAFDESLKEIKDKKGDLVFKNGKISKDKLYNYLVANEKSENKTYAEYLFGANYEQILKEQKKIATFGMINISKQSFVVMGITSQVGTFYKIIGGAAVTIGTVAIIFTPMKYVAGAMIVGGVGAGFGGKSIADLFEPEIAAIVVEGNGINNKFMAPTIQEVDSDKFKALDCKDILTYT